MTRVLIADDHQMVLEGLNVVLSNHPDLQVVKECLNGEEVLEYLKSNTVDVVVLDINMPKIDGLTCARRIKKAYDLKVIMLTMYAQKSFIEEMLTIGVDGCILKNNTGKELVEAVLRVAGGRSYFDQIHEFTEVKNKANHYNLGERELEVIKLLAEGLTSNEIAERLFISEHTVKTHRKNILRKTELHSTHELIKFAINNELI